MAWHRTGDRPLPELMMTQFTDAYVRHQASMILPVVMIYAHITKQPLQWRNNGCDGISNQQHHNCLLNRIFRRRSKKTSKLRVTGLCVGNSPVTGEFPAQMPSNAENVSIWWRHHVTCKHAHKLRVCIYVQYLCVCVQKLQAIFLWGCKNNF